MMKASDNWNSFFTELSGGDLTSGKGFGIRSNSNTYVTFSGEIVNNDINFSVTSDGNGWNLVGNPFTSAIYTKQEVFGFLIENSDAINDSYEAIYLWDPTENTNTGGYIILNYGSEQSTLAPVRVFL